MSQIRAIRPTRKWSIQIIPYIMKSVLKLKQALWKILLLLIKNEKKIVSAIKQTNVLG